MSNDDSLPTDLANAHSLIIAQRAALIAAQSEAAHRALLIEKLNYTIKKLRHEQFGQSSERGALLDQLELQLADVEEDVASRSGSGGRDDYGAIFQAAQAGAQAATRASAARAHRPLPSVCPCCGDSRLRKIGEDVTETLELIPRQWKVIAHVREKFSCRACEAITQPPAPSHPIARGHAGPKLIAHILFSKYGLHLPLNRQSDMRWKASISMCRRSPAGWGAAAATLMPLVEVIKAHVFAAERIHSDTRPCQSWRRRRPARDGYGLMCATTIRSAGLIRQRQCLLFA
jgi:transposase